MTSTINGNATINSSASIAVRSSVVPESACSAVRPVNTTASVSSAVKVRLSNLCHSNAMFSAV